MILHHYLFAKGTRPVRASIARVEGKKGWRAAQVLAEISALRGGLELGAKGHGFIIGPSESVEAALRHPSPCHT